MPLTITPELINGIYNSGQSDAVLQSVIDNYESKVGECLSSSIGDAIGGIALANYIAYVFYDPNLTVKSEKGSFGDSVTYADNLSGADSYLMKARALDTGGCLTALQNTPFGLITIGQYS